MLTSKIHHQRHLGFSDLVSVYPTNPDAFVVDVKHDLGGLVLPFAKEPLQYKHDEFHRRVVIVEQQNFVERRFLGLGPRFRDDSCAAFVVVSATVAPYRLFGRHRRVKPSCTADMVATCYH